MSSARALRASGAWRSAAALAAASAAAPSAAHAVASAAQAANVMLARGLACGSSLSSLCAAAAQAHAYHAASPARHYSSTSALLGGDRRIPRGRRQPPPRSARHDAEWDLVRSARNPRVTTVDPAHPLPSLPPNDEELAALGFSYGLPPLPSLSERQQQYAVEQSYYDRRDLRIRAHLDRLLRMQKMSKKEMLILIDQVESAHWNLPELRRAYLPEVRHAEKDDEAVHRASLLVGTGGVAYKAAYKKRQEEKKARRAADGPKTPTDDGEPKYGYRRDLVNFGPEFWDYLTPYVIFEPEARHLSHLDGAFRYEDRYVLWEAEHRNLALAAKLQRMKLLGIPLEHASAMPTPDYVGQDPPYPNARVRRLLARRLAAGGRADEAFWRSIAARQGAGERDEEALIAAKEKRTMTLARKNIPKYIDRFERESSMQSVDVGAQTVLAQNLYIQRLMNAKREKYWAEWRRKHKGRTSLLTPTQQESAKNLLSLFAQRNRLALRKMFLGTRNTWELLMLQRAIERKYLERYSTVGSDAVSAKLILAVEQEMIQVVEEHAARYREIDWDAAIYDMREQRDLKEYLTRQYESEYAKKVEEIMEANGELLEEGSERPGGTNWIEDMLEWERNSDWRGEKKAHDDEIADYAANLNRELDSWNEFFDVQVADELARMIDCGEIEDEDNVTDGAIELASMRVSKRLNATRGEWKEWKYRPQHVRDENMLAPPADVRRVPDDKQQEAEAATEGQKVVQQILSSDRRVQASNKWKQRMGPRFAELDRAEAEGRPGTLIQHLAAGGKQGGKGRADPIVPGAPAGSVLGAPDGFEHGKVSTTGLQVLDLTDPVQRRRAVEHAKTLEQPHETIRAQIEDPMLQLLYEHARNNRDGRMIKSGGVGGNDVEGSGDRNAFSTLNPKLGFSDDDFRLYDPVLTKGGGSDDAAVDDGSITSELALGSSYGQTGHEVLSDPETDPAIWKREEDRARRRAHFLDLDPFGPANTDERRDFDDAYLHLDEEEYAFRKRVDPNTEHMRPLTQQSMLNPDDELPDVVQFELAEETSELLYMLHRQDPVKWTPRALAHKFRLSAERVKGHLVMRAIHYRMVEAGVEHPLVMHYDDERALDDIVRPKMLMIHDPPKMTPARMPDYRWVREDDLHRVLAEEKAIEDRYLTRGQRLDKAEREYYAKYGAIGTDIPPPAEPRVLDERLLPPTRHSMMLVDTSELPACRFAIAVRDKRGFLREPSETEYHYVRKREKGVGDFFYVKYHNEATPM